jgi:hypothetical protein
VVFNPCNVPDTETLLSIVVVSVPELYVTPVKVFHKFVTDALMVLYDPSKVVILLVAVVSVE